MPRRHRKGLDSAPPRSNKAFDALEALGVVGEITGKRRGRVFAYAEFLKILESGTQLRQAGG